jgi:hypothetical protein
MGEESGGGVSEIEHRGAAQQPVGELFTAAGARNAAIARAAAELAATQYNTLVMHPPDPIVKPRVRLFSQWEGPWAACYVRKPGQRNSPSPDDDKIGDNPATPQKAPDGKDNWKNNGCFPTCVSMIVRWWAEDNPETKDKLTFPFTGSGAALDPVETCRRLFGIPYAPCMKPAQEWLINQDAILNGFGSIKRPARPSEGLQGLAPYQVFPLRWKRIALAGDLEERRSALKSALQYGPAIVRLQYPAHLVVVDAHRGNEISICDPGAILVNPREWKTGPASRSGADLPAGAAPHKGYVQVNDKKVFETADGGFKEPWLMQILSIIQFYMSDADIHPEWSNLQETH